MSVVEAPARPKAATPLKFFEAVYMNPDLPLGTRLRAATVAAKYVHPRLEAIGIAQMDAQGTSANSCAKPASAAVRL